MTTFAARHPADAATRPVRPSPPRFGSGRDRLVAVALGAAVFAVYAAGASPTIYVGDSGELATAAATLGIPHPSGYPLYVLLGKLWITLLPAGSVAWRLSLFSAAAAAGAVALLHLVLRDLGARPLAAATGALLLAFAPSYWQEANVQRVYALNALALVAAVGLALAWDRDRTADPRRAARALVGAAFVAGLGASNHTFMAVAAAAIAIFALVRDRTAVLRPRRVAAAAGAFAVGLLPYLYLPLRSRHDPHLDWGDPETLDRFFAVVTRREFWDRRWLTSAADLLPIAVEWATGIGRELVGGAALAVLGAVVLARRRGPLLLPLLVAVGNLVAMALHGSRADLFVWNRYDIPTYAMAALLAGVGAEALAARLPRRAVPLLLALPLALAATGWRAADRSRYAIAEDFSRQLLAGVVPGTHLVASDDNVLFPLLYLHHVEGWRPDVDLVAQGVAGELAPLRFDPDAEALHFTHDPGWDQPALAVVPVGLSYRVVRSGRAVALPPLPTGLAGEDDPRVPKDHLTRSLIGHFHFMLAVTWEGRDPQRALAELARAAAAAPDDRVLHYNLGLVWLRNGRSDAALAAFRRSAAIDPRPLPGPDAVRAADRIAEIERSADGPR